MLLRQLFMGACGLSFGLLASAGVFTVLASVGLIPRFAGKMHVARKVFALEEAVIFGTVLGGILSVYGENWNLGAWIVRERLLGAETEMLWPLIGRGILTAGGFFAGIFVGCLALAIAEMLNSIPILSRRIGFRHGLGAAITAAALGKLAGSLIYFIQGVFLTGE